MIIVSTTLTFSVAEQLFTLCFQMWSDNTFVCFEHTIAFNLTACKRHVNIFMQRCELTTIKKYTQVIFWNFVERLLI